MHWNGQTWRFWESDFQIRSHLTQRYGARKFAGLQLQDWGVTWNEIEPCFDQFEYLCGVSGKAGNLKGQVRPGGNPFESARSRDYPTPPLKMSYAPTLFAQTVREQGYHPFPTPASNLSTSYVNRWGCAWDSAPIAASASASPAATIQGFGQTTILPVLMKKSNFELRTECEVLKVNLHPDGQDGEKRHLYRQGRGGI